jgi:hypothetical protein
LANTLEEREEQTVSYTSGRAKSRPIANDTWPSAEAWNQRPQALLTTTFRKLGIGPERETSSGIWASQVLDVLGPGSFAEFDVIRSPGRVIWCNFELARQLGFEVPRSNQLTPKFHEQLLTALSFRAVGPGDALPAQETLKMYADRYGGDGVAPCLGAGRAGFLPYGNLYVKGVGLTQLFKSNDPNDFVHSHGGVYLEDCLTEAVFGEANENLFSCGSIRVLAIIDQGKHVTEPSGRQRPIALVVRAGAQLRPGHLLGKQRRPSRSALDMFISIAKATHQLVTRQDELTDERIPDVAATMLRIIDDHARTGADGFRWRMIHGAISSSNMEMSGAMLDLPTQSAQPRTAPVWTLDYAESVYGSEHKERAFQLVPMYRKVLRTTKPQMRERFNAKWVNIPAEMETAYRRHLQLRLLSAAGLKTEAARRIQTEHAELAGRFADLIVDISRMKNPGSVSLSKAVVEHVSVVDIFHLLGTFPGVYFENPNADHDGTILRCLKPVYKGNRFHVAKKQTAVNLLVSEFARLYRELMDAAAEYAEEYYDDLDGMQASIIARAGFENEPLDALYYHKLYEDMNKAIAAYRLTGNEEIRDAIDRRIFRSLRNVEALLVQGSSRRLRAGGIELQMRTIEAVSHSVRAWNDARQTRRLHVSIPVERNGSHYTCGVPTLPHLTHREIQSLRYRFTTDGGKTFGVVKAHLKHDARDGLIIDFDDICTLPLVGRLEGELRIGNARGENGKRYVGGYTFVIPDRQELSNMLARPVAGLGRL